MALPIKVPDLAIKTQYIIMVIIVASLVVIVMAALFWFNAAINS